MIGISSSQYKSNVMDFDVDKLTILFMVGYERPSYDPNINHISLRIQYARNWYEYMGGVENYNRRCRRIVLWKNKYRQ